MSSYKNLDAWKSGMELVKLVYDVTKSYPKEELFGLTSQTKRAAVSVVANIAEGSGRQYKKDTLQFLYVSRGSLYELETHFFIANDTGIITDELFGMFYIKWEKTIQLLNGLIRYYENSTGLK